MKLLVRSKPLAVLQMGRPPEDLRNIHLEQSHWILAALKGITHPIWVINVEEQLPPSHADLAGAILTGSWSMVTAREPWSERVGDWIRQAAEYPLPMLGICYGHQLMADALGGTVDYHPLGREIGQHEITLAPEAAQDCLLSDTAPSFKANLTHEQSVLVPPKGAITLGSSPHDPHQILRYSQTSISVQFHPEFTPVLMNACLLRRRQLFAREGFDVQRMCAELEPTPAAADILRRWAAVTCRLPIQHSAFV